jgi:allantoicase
MPVTHLRVHIFPHGGVNRLRAFGRALDGALERRALDSLHAQSDAGARTLFLSFCGANAFADSMLARRPFASMRDLFSAAEDALWSLSADDWLQAFAAHPRLGERKAAPAQVQQSVAWSRAEQAGLAGVQDDVAERLAAANDQYFDKFGFIFILFATGRTAPEVLERLRERLQNDRPTEIDGAAREQAKITRSRIGKWILGQ